MKTVAATLVFCVASLTTRAQEKVEPVGDPQVYKTVDGQRTAGTESTEWGLASESRRS